MSRLASKTCKENIIQIKIVFNEYKYLCFDFCPGAQGLYQANLLLSGCSPVTVQIQLPKTRNRPGAGPDWPKARLGQPDPKQQVSGIWAGPGQPLISIFGISIFQKCYFWAGLGRPSQATFLRGKEKTFGCHFNK